MAHASFMWQQVPQTPITVASQQHHHQQANHQFGAQQTAAPAGGAATATASSPLLATPPTALLTMAANHPPSTGAYLTAFPQAMACNFGSPFGFPAAIICLPVYLPLQVLPNTASDPFSAAAASFQTNQQPHYLQQQQQQQQSPVPPPIFRNHHSQSALQGGCQNQNQHHQLRPARPSGVHVRYREYPPTTAPSGHFTPNHNHNRNLNPFTPTKNHIAASSSCRPHTPRPGSVEPLARPNVNQQTQQERSVTLRFGQPPATPQQQLPDSTCDPKEKQKQTLSPAKSAGDGKGKDPWWKLPEFIPLSTSSPKPRLPTAAAAPKPTAEPKSVVAPVVEENEYKMYRLVFLNCLDNTCEQAFGSRAALQEHLLEDHDINEHQCPLMSECRHSFERREHLWAHLKTAHKGVLSWKCHFCERIFDDPRIFEEHVDLEHREGFYECTFADCKFNDHFLMPVLDHYKFAHNRQGFVDDHDPIRYKRPS